MKFAFICPLKLESFFSERFEITDNRGIALDEHGNRYLNARIQLTAPCPFCGEHHAYQAKELACPFSSNEERESTEVFCAELETGKPNQ
jgi:hypothetical protein